MYFKTDLQWGAHRPGTLSVLRSAPTEGCQWWWRADRVTELPLSWESEQCMDFSIGEQSCQKIKSAHSRPISHCTQITNLDANNNNHDRCLTNDQVTVLPLWWKQEQCHSCLGFSTLLGSNHVATNLRCKQIWEKESSAEDKVYMYDILQRWYIMDLNPTDWTRTVEFYARIPSPRWTLALITLIDHQLVPPHCYISTNELSQDRYRSGG